MTTLAEAAMWWRLARRLRPFLRRTLSQEEARAGVVRRLQERSSRFLRMAERTVYGNSRSPYRALLEAAGCGLKDLEQLVAAEGVEGALSRLHQAGVYVTLDEFKGREAAVRGSQRFHFAESDFDNHGVAPDFSLRSGGTRGPGTSVRMGLDYISEMAANTALSLRVHDLLSFDPVIWVLPTGWIFTLRYAKLARPPIACFYPMRPPSRVLQAGSWLLAAAGRRDNRSFPMPRLFDLEEAERMVVWLRQRLEEGRSVSVTCYASSAVRVSLAAQDQGTSLAGVAFITLGEPVTEAKKRVIEASGARMLVHFGLTEAGLVAFSCARPESADDLHVFTDNFALVQRSREVGATGVRVEALLLSSLIPTAPKILLNTETGDYGVLERRRCGCEFGALGLCDHLSGVRSFEKLSSEGMTFAQSDLLEVLESKLPARFGGTAADYQILEEESENGLQRVNLIVSPRVGEIDHELVRAALLEELARDGMFGRVGSAVWRKAQTVEVSRRWPVATGAGKVLPFHLLGQ